MAGEYAKRCESKILRWKERIKLVGDSGCNSEASRLLKKNELSGEDAEKKK